MTAISSHAGSRWVSGCGGATGAISRHTAATKQKPPNRTSILAVGPASQPGAIFLSNACAPFPERLNKTLFLTARQARPILARCVEDYNTERPLFWSLACNIAPTEAEEQDYATADDIHIVAQIATKRLRQTRGGSPRFIFKR